MNNTDFWASINAIIAGGFTPEGLSILDEYADKFTCGKLLYKRFSPSEQHGCSTGGYAHVIASLLAGAENRSGSETEGKNDFQRQCKRAETQAKYIENWARKAGCWIDDVDEILESLMGAQIAEGGEAHVYDHGTTLVKSIGLDYFIEPILALDRVTLHNTYFPETKLVVIGFGRDKNEEFRILIEQPFIEGSQMTDQEIADFMNKMGFKLINPRNWTFATSDIYLSDMHDENVIRSAQGNIFVVDCDIRINTPELRCGGIRQLTTEVEFVKDNN
ncbi:MAG: hypothetical protein MJZ33_03995 [Paludibacteraceae bacterium]|nr:hypothetical protein [Paludibacteraceae bacterium]